MKSSIHSSNKKAVLLIALGLTGIATFTRAQGINEQVTVTAAFEPTISEAAKLSISPSPDETVVKLPVMTYSVKPLQMETTLKPDNITPVKLVGEPVKKLYRNYARVGFGNYTTPYAEFFANSLRSKTYAFGVHLKHLSSSGKIKDYPKSSNSLNLIQLSGQKYTDNHSISAGAGYRRNVAHHYGFIPAEAEMVFDEDSLKQRFNRLNFNAGIKSKYTESDRLNHLLGISFNSIGDLFKTRESLIRVNTRLDKRFELFDLTDYQVLALDADLRFTGYKDSTLKQKSSVITLKPSISTEFEEYRLLLGFDFSVQIDSASKVYLFPFAEAQVRALEDAIVITAGITGGLTRKGFDVLSDVNPFVQSALPLRYTRDRFTFYAGARARAGKYIDLSASFSTSSVENEGFFINDPTLKALNRFTLVYHDGNVMKGRFEAGFHTGERISIKAFASFEKWTLTNDEKPWHRPVSSFGAEGSYDIQKKILVKAGFTTNGKQFAQLPSPDREEDYLTRTVKGYTDINLGVEYRYTKLLSAFINFSNLTGSRYYLWYNYPAYRFRLMGGISYSF
jgi:outer membrane receptor protein involved in Fe transport